MTLFQKVYQSVHLPHNHKVSRDCPNFKTSVANHRSRLGRTISPNAKREQDLYDPMEYVTRLMFTKQKKKSSMERSRTRKKAKTQLDSLKMVLQVLHGKLNISVRR